MLSYYWLCKSYLKACKCWSVKRKMFLFKSRIYATMGFLTEEMKRAQFIRGPSKGLLSRRQNSKVRVYLWYIRSALKKWTYNNQVIRIKLENKRADPSLVCSHRPPPLRGRRSSKHPLRLSFAPRSPSSSRPQGHRPRRSSL